MPFRRKPPAPKKPVPKPSPYATGVPFWKFWKSHPNDAAARIRNPPGPSWGKDPLRVAGFSIRKPKRRP